MTPEYFPKDYNGMVPNIEMTSHVDDVSPATVNTRALMTMSDSTTWREDFSERCGTVILRFDVCFLCKI